MISGKVSDRPGLSELLKKLTRGDVLTVWKLDRLGRSVSHICQIVEHFQAAGIIIKSLSDGITYDPESLMGRALLQQMAIFSELERGLIQERSKLGIQYAKKHGTRSGKAIGRPTVSSPKMQHALDLLAQGKSFRQVARITDVSLSSLVRYAKKAREQGELMVQSNIFQAIASASA